MSASAEERRRIAGWNSTHWPYDRRATICDVVAAAAARWPERPAIVGDSGVVYRHRELDARSNRIANMLNGLGQGRGSLVPFLGGHTPEAVACLLGILKAGAAYVPLHPRWPYARLRAVLEPIGASCLVHARDQYARATELIGELPTIRHLVCPEIDEAEPPPEPLDPDVVRDLWDGVASSEDELRASGFNFGTGGRYSREDVAAYRDRVVALVRSRGGRGGRLLDIGCGAGLLLRALAPEAARYVGLDPSRVAIARNREWARRAGVAVELIEGFAHEATRTVAGPFDVVVLASVVQFFPGPAYLTAVVNEAAKLLAPGGVVIVADVVDPASGQVPEGLRLPRGFFADLARASGAFVGADVYERDPASFPAELAARYDVVMARGTPDGPPATRVWTGWHVTRHLTDPPASPPQADDRAYVMFTSGSTGQPKGVAVQHRPVVNLLQWVNRAHGVTPDDRLLFVTALSFDLSVYDMFGILAAGASLRVVPDARLAEPEMLVDVIESEPITFWDSAPATLIALMPFAKLRRPVPRPPRLLVFLSGDWVPVSLPAQIQRWLPHARIVVLGGTTETTVWANDFVVSTVDPAWPSIPYGKPIQNTRYYVLDGALDMCAIGEVGDLYIAGDCLSLGYLGDAELTAAKFVADPHSPTPGDRMYATGDRGRWRDDGNLEFLGRVDHQVKIRGHRIELGDVEAALKRCPGVLDSVAAVVGTGTVQRLVGFVLAPSRPDPKDVKAMVRSLLPDAMVPAAIHVLDSFPLGPTGKTDRAALRRLEEDGAGPVQALRSPLDVHEAVRNLWASLLAQPTVHEADDFFDLGGDSLLAARLVAEVRRVFGVPFAVRELFERPGLGDMVQIIESRRSSIPAGDVAAS